jgi:hypothetical protein
MHQGSRGSKHYAGGLFGTFRRTGLRSVLGPGVLRARRPGQAAVETALTAAISIMTILSVLQLSMVAAQAFSAAHVARSTARWLAVRMDTTDSGVTTQAQTLGAGLPGMSGGGLASVSVTPSCANLTPPPPATGGICTGREQGTAIKVTVNTNVGAVMFLPTSFGIAPFRFSLPASTQTMSFGYTVLLE